MRASIWHKITSRPQAPALYLTNAVMHRADAVEASAVDPRLWRNAHDRIIATRCRRQSRCFAGDRCRNRCSCPWRRRGQRSNLSAIERYRRALDAFESADEISKPSQFEAAGDELHAASETLFATSPTTVTGCLALMDWMLVDADGEDLEHHRAALKSLIEVLPRLVGSALT